MTQPDLSSLALPDSPEPACMMCGSKDYDSTSNERHPEHGPDVWEFWTYCKACDCWTEHFPRYVGPLRRCLSGSSRGEE